MNIENPTPTPHLPIYIPIYLLTHPFINLPICLSTKPPTYSLPITYLITYLPTHPPTYLPISTNLPTH